MSALLAILDALAKSGRAASVPARTLEDLAAALRLHEARATYLLSYGDAFTQRVLRGEIDQHILADGTEERA